MENNKVYFEELIERIKVGDYKKIVMLKDYNGYQVKFGSGIMLMINRDTGRAIINLFDNKEIDVEEIYSLIKDAQIIKAEKRVTKAKERLARVQQESCACRKKSIWQRLFGK